MKKPLLSLICCTVLASCEKAPPPFDPEKIIALEKTALDRWGKGDPQGYLETYAPDITYFDPGREKRADGIQAMKDYLAPITGKVRVRSYEMTDAKIQRLGDVAVLSYQLTSHAIMPDGSPYTARWNSTKVYGLYNGNWKLFHDHWSFIKPELKNPPTGPQ
jgi:ketosteroid isomerase-like protein